MEFKGIHLDLSEQDTALIDRYFSSYIYNDAYKGEVIVPAGHLEIATIVNPCLRNLAGGIKKPHKVTKQLANAK